MKLSVKKLSIVFALFMATYAVAEQKAEEPDQTVLLESTFVGDKEQPAVSYFIPWKGNTTPDKLQWNMERKHDQTLQIIDRDVVLNSMNIYNEMNLETSVSPD